TLNAIAANAERFALAEHTYVASASLEHDAALVRRGLRRDARRRQHKETLAQTIDALAGCRRERERFTAARLQRTHQLGPLVAPSMRPGMSAMTSSRSSSRATPRFGVSVVNG